MSDEETVLVTARVPERLREQAKDNTSHGGLSNAIRNTLEVIAWGEDTSKREEISERLNTLRDERADLQNQKQHLENEIQQLDVKISRLESNLSQLEDQQGKYEGMLEAMGAELESGKRFFEGHAQVRKAAEIGNCTEQDVLNDLQERNESIPESQFKDPVENGEIEV